MAVTDSDIVTQAIDKGVGLGNPDITNHCALFSVFESLRKHLWDLCCILYLSPIALADKGKLGNVGADAEIFRGGSIETVAFNVPKTEEQRI